MDFARKILQNYGWKDGDGLGKNKTGIAKPLKPTLKFDNAGFGADQAADDFNNHWWERVFNEAAKNVNITQEGKQIIMELKDEDAVEISTKGYSMKRLKKLKKSRGEIGINKSSYGNFLQAATLTNLEGEVESPDKIDTNVIDVSKTNVLTDEELFKACGGRTAHKGARHGLKLSGKLARIEQQEAELLAKMEAKRSGFIDGAQSKNKMQSKSSTSEKIKKQCEEQAKNRNNAADEPHDVCEIFVAGGDKLKKKKFKLSKVASDENGTNIQEVSFIKKNKANKKMKMVENNDVQTSNEDLISKKNSDKLKNKKRKLSEVAGTETDTNIQDTPFLKSKKRTNKKIQSENNSQTSKKDNHGETDMRSKDKISDNIEKIVDKKKNKQKDA